MKGRRNSCAEGLQKEGIHVVNKIKREREREREKGGAEDKQVY